MIDSIEAWDGVGGMCAEARMEEGCGYIMLRRGYGCGVREREFFFLLISFKERGGGGGSRLEENGA